MKITKVDEMTSGTSKLEDAISKFEKEFKTQKKDLDYYHLVIYGEYNRETCDEIEKIYSEGGWKKVVCKTSSENGERAGLTGLQLWRV